MLISPSRRLIFVHIQKTGGDTVTTLLRQQVDDLTPLLAKHEKAARGQQVVSDWDDYFSFAFVRNPWDRLVSWYHMIANATRLRWYHRGDPKKRSHYHQVRHNPMWRYLLENASSFTEFLDRCTDDVEVEPGVVYNFFTNQVEYLEDAHHRRIVTFVGRLENFAADLGHVFDELGLAPPAIHRENVSRHRHYRDYYTPRTRDLVARRYQRDIDTFGYSF